MTEIAQTVDDIEKEIRRCTRSLHEDFNDKEKLSYWNAKISALEWVLGRG